MGNPLFERCSSAFAAWLLTTGIYVGAQALPANASEIDMNQLLGLAAQLSVFDKNHSGSLDGNDWVLLNRLEKRAFYQKTVTMLTYSQTLTMGVSVSNQKISEVIAYRVKRSYPYIDRVYGNRANRNILLIDLADTIVAKLSGAR